MPSPQNENFGEMVRSVLLDYPHYDEAIIKRKINDHLRELIARRPWSGLVKRGMLDISAEYNTGTLTVTNGDTEITGTATAWPVSDVASTTITEDILDRGRIQSVVVAALTGLKAGQWIVIDAAQSAEEAVFIMAVNADETSITARFENLHSSGAAITVSSLAGRQMKIAADNPLYTVTGVTSATTLLVDFPWAGVSATTQSYSLSQAFVSFGHDCKQLLTVVNLQSHWQLRTDLSKDYLDIRDPRRTTTQSTYMCVFHETDPSGAPLWELYPRPTSKAEFVYFYVKQWQPLTDDNDFLPNGIRSDVVLMRVRGEAARWPGHRKVDGGIYYDPNASKLYLQESEFALQRMMVDDDNTSVMTAFYDYRNWRLGDQYYRDHDWYDGE